MKNCIRLRFAFDQIIQNIKTSILAIMLITVCLILISFSLIGFQGMNYAEQGCNEILSSGIIGTGVIYLNSDSKYYYDFITEVYNTEEISSIGSCLIGSNNLEEFNILKQVQLGKTNNYINTLNDNLEIFFINQTMINLCKINLEDGSFQTVSDTETYIYLGNKYKNKVDIGHKFYANGNEYIVAGILKEGAAWINPDVVDGIYSSDIDNTINLDYAVIFSDNMLYRSALFFNISSDTTMNDTIKIISRKAQKYNLDISIGSLDEMYEYAKDDNQLLMSYLIQIIIVVLFCSITMISSLQGVSILHNQKIYGILYSIGFSENDINIMIVFENAFNILFSLILCFICDIPIIYKWFGNNLVYEALKQIFFPKVLPFICICALIILFISSLIPIGILNKLTPSNLIGGKDD